MTPASPPTPPERKPPAAGVPPKEGTRRRKRPMEHIPLDGIAWLTREEFCAALRVERRTYMRLVADGFIQETRLGPSSIRIASTEMTALAARLAAAKGKKK